MSLLPIINGKVKFDSGAVSAEDVFNSGIRFVQTGEVRCTTSAGTFFNQGIPMSESGQVSVVDATAGLPSGTVFANGLPISDNKLCVSSNSVAVTVNGITFDSAGAVAATGFGPTPATTDSFFKYVTVLLHGDGTNGAQNNTFLDGSTNNFTITRNGNTTQGSFSPFSQTGWSNYFDGTGDYLSVADNVALRMESGDFTIEFWWSPSSIAGFQTVLEKGYTAAGGLLLQTGSGNGTIVVYAAGVAVITASSGSSVGAWDHYALVRSGTTLTLYRNGASVGSATNSTNFNSTASLFVGGSTGGGGYYVNGYLSNARIVKGTAVYTSAFTPPTAPLTAITNTSLLTCQSNRFRDNSSNAFAITRNGDVRVEAFSPFNPSTTYSTANVGGSGYFDGAGDYLTVPTNAALGLATGDFTVECWVNVTGGAGTYRCAISFRNSSLTGIQPDLYIWNTNVAVWYVSGAAVITGTTNLTGAGWAHIAVVRNSGNTRLYVNGVQEGSTYVDSNNYPAPGTTLAVGSNPAVPQDFIGYISSARVVKGTAVYTAAFTPPTAPLTAITNTSLLLNFTNGGIFDNASQTVLETVGNAQVSTTQKKYGTGSMYFDGTGDRLVMPARPPMAVGSGNFTIEGWVYRLDTNTRGVFQLSGTAGGLQANTTTNLALGSDTGSVWRIYANNSAYNSTATWVINTWYHFALVRSSGVTTLYINGVSVITQADTTNYTGQNLCVGGFYDTTFLLNGYIDDLRITNGYARYTANFTPPTAAFPDN